MDNRGTVLQLISYIKSCRDAPWDRTPFNAKMAAFMVYSTIKSGLQIVVDGDKDPDGVWSEKIVEDIFDSHGFTNYVSVRTPDKRHGVDGATYNLAKKKGVGLLIVLDSSFDKLQELKEFSNTVPVLVIDHHKPTGDLPAIEMNKFLYINSHLETGVGDWDYKSTSCGLLTYLVFKNLIPNSTLDKELASLAYASVISDSIPMDSEAIISFMEYVRQTNIMHPLLLVFKTPYTKFNREFISYTVAPRMNACYRVGRLDLIHELVCRRDYRIYLTQNNETVKDIEVVYKDGRALLARLYANVKPIISNGFVIVDLNPAITKLNESVAKVKMFTGLVANEYTAKFSKPCMAFVESNSKYKGSVRDFAGRNLLSPFQSFVNAGGHDPAFGFTARRDDFNVLTSRLNMIEKRMPEVENKNLMLAISSEDMVLKNSDFAKSVRLFSEVNEMGSSIPNVYYKVVLPSQAQFQNSGRHAEARIGDVVLESFSGNLYPNVNYLFKPMSSRLVK